MPEDRNGLIINPRPTHLRIMDGLSSILEGDDEYSVSPPTHIRFINGVFAFLTLTCLMASEGITYPTIECLWLIYAWPIPKKLVLMRCGIPCQIFASVFVVALLNTSTLPNLTEVSGMERALPFPVILANALLCLYAIIQALPYSLLTIQTNEFMANYGQLAKRLINFCFALGTLSMLLMPLPSNSWFPGWHATGMELTWLLFNCLTYRSVYSKGAARVFISIVFFTMFCIGTLICCMSAVACMQAKFIWPSPAELFCLPNIAFVVISVFVCGRSLQQSIALKLKQNSSAPTEAVPVSLESQSPDIAASQDISE